MPDRFTNRTPPLTETFSFRELPCLFEDFSQTASSYACRYKPLCTTIATTLSWPVRYAYDRMVQVTLAEPSSNIVSRSESHYNRREQARLSLRKHFYEVTPNPPSAKFDEEKVAAIADQAGRRPGPLQQKVKEITEWLTRFAAAVGREDYSRWNELEERLRGAVAELDLDPVARGTLIKIVRENLVSETQVDRVLDCRPIDSHSRFAKYLGFVDIRTASARSPIAMGLLVPPRNLRHDPDVHVISGEYAQIFGAAGFHSTVFSMHDEMVSGARCAQACIIMALGTLADRGANVIGSYDITFLGKRREPLAPPGTPCLSTPPQSSAGSRPAFQITGLDVQETLDVLRDPQCGTGAHYFAQEDSRTVRRMVARLIEGYLLARYPAILPVHASTWWQGGPDENHSVLVIGVRRGCKPTEQADSQQMSEITELIMHDPGFGPFLKRPLDECLEASLASKTRTRVGEAAQQPATHAARRIRLIFVTEARIRRRASNGLEVIADRDWEAWKQFIGVPEDGAQMPQHERDASSQSDYRVSLVNRRDLLKTFAVPDYDTFTLSRQYRRDRHSRVVQRAMWFKGQLQGLREGWYWCVAGYYRRRLAILWMFHVDSDNDAEWDRCVVFPGA